MMAKLPLKTALRLQSQSRPKNTGVNRFVQGRKGAAIFIRRTAKWGLRESPVTAAGAAARLSSWPRIAAKHPQAPSNPRRGFLFDHWK